ncbi:heat stress transcription factor A-2b-like [Eucalyptus grandis]|uniref:heat stress transcription factor A-2b-like n=1 Tax=Eucalyptus grandis TaxID=71139 RepID=UPI00192E9D4E|nr:heat stress transcription factor A-2b-like [Eucalyptus grandis]
MQHAEEKQASSSSPQRRRRARPPHTEGSEARLLEKLVPYAKQLGAGLPRRVRGLRHLNPNRSLSVPQGFRKIDPDRWEFANEGFRGGKKHLLKNIKRRGRITKKKQGPTIPEDIQTTEMDFQRTEVESEIRTLKEDQETLKSEILELRQQQECSQSEIGAVEERIRCAECRQQQMFLFLAKAVRNPHFVERLVQKRKPNREIQAGKFIKKRRLLTSKPDPNRCDFEGTNDDKSSACGDGQKGILMFNNVMLHEDASTIYDAVLEKLLDDSGLIAKGEIGEELAVTVTYTWNWST